jgi:NAD(P)-dependent dehydrogenase (short-subunit alcohol dehydrogenase family)
MAVLMSDDSLGVAVVTGAANGIGRAVTRRLLDEDMRVVGGDIDGDALDKLAGELGGQRERFFGHVVDVSLQESMEQLAEATRAHFGDARLVISNAGVNSYGFTGWATPPNVWNWLLGVNLMGAVHAVQSFMPHMERLGFGNFVNVGSVASLGADPMNAAYGASKHALLGYSEALYFELQVQQPRIHVSVVLPRNTATTIRRSAARLPARFGDDQVAGGSADTLPPLAVSEGAMRPEDVADVIWRASAEGGFLYTAGFGPDVLWNRIGALLGLAPDRSRALWAKTT